MGLREYIYAAAAVSVSDAVARSNWEAATTCATDAVYGPGAVLRDVATDNQILKELGANCDTADNND
jgi:hypothetical protein